MATTASAKVVLNNNQQFCGGVRGGQTTTKCFAELAVSTGSKGLNTRAMTQRGMKINWNKEED
jgi:hypothetical protein